MKNILELKNNVKNTRAIFDEINAKYSVVAADYDEKLQALREQFQSENKDLIDAFKGAQLHKEVAEDALRDALVENYQNTGVKTFDKDLSVRVATKVSYPTMNALAWARTNAPFLVIETLDTKAFEPIAKADPDRFDFVEVVEKVSAVISTNLSE